MKKKVCIALISSGAVLLTGIAALVILYKAATNIFNGGLDLDGDWDIDL